ncbi:MAG: flagellar hook-associated protein FlgK, partial [Synergistaceae bacterium]|nr:flagellar hook-associated protein FlgK [Synergistaceae bacterium]
FRLGMQTVGHNIANMGTEGYSRQRVNYATNVPMDLPGIGQVGQGMHVSDIERIRDEFLDFQFRDTQTALGYWEKVSQLYDSIQNYISEPNSSGIRNAMNTFFTDLQTLQQSPEDTSTRRSLVESARSLGDMLSALTDNFQTYNKSVNMEIQSSVADINRMLYDIAALNKEIAQAEALDQTANDLRDSRDLILDKLSKMIDITYNEPLESKDGVPGEFFVTLNGRAIVQGTHVRELKAHAFMWDNQVYYDVQVAENEFDIVSNPAVADILAAGPEGNYLLSVDRIANGVEWTTGGGDAHCMEVRAAVTSSFEGGKILTSDSKDIPYKLSFRVLDENKEPSILTIKIDKDTGGWKLRAEIDGKAETDSNGDVISQSITGDLTINNLADFINSKASSFTINGVTQDPVNLKVTADTTNNTLTFVPNDSINGNSPVEITDYSGMLGNLTEIKAELEKVNMRSRVNSIDEALNISGSFRIQVGTQGTRVTSKIFTDNPSENLDKGFVLNGLNAGTIGEKHTFRIGVAGDQVDITASWNDSTKAWTLSSDLGNSTTYNETVDVNEIATFITDTITRSKTTGDNPEFSKLRVVAGPSTNPKTQFYIESSDNHLISISDVEGALAEHLGMVNDNPVITIDVESSDSLATIRNKINEKYQAELGLTKPEQWVHASLQQDSDQSWYLTIAADVAGEAQRITLMGAEDGNMQVLRRLGLTKNEEISVDMNVANAGNTVKSWALEGTEDLSSWAGSGTSGDITITVGGTAYGPIDLTQIASANDLVSEINKTVGKDIASMNSGKLILQSSNGAITVKGNGNAVTEIFDSSKAPTDTLTSTETVKGTADISNWAGSSTSGSLIINIDDGNNTQYGPIDLTQIASANDLVTQINTAAGKTIASLDSGKLTLESSDGPITVTGTGKAISEIFGASKSYREVAYIPSTGIAQDASFSLNGVRYLSSDNMFKEARRIPSINTDGSSNYSATALSEVSDGMWFNLKNSGVTSVTVKHHVQGGSVKGLEEVRDGFIPNMKDALNEVAFNLAKNFNAYQYSGYGIASEINTTGTAFFTPLATKAGAAKALTV